MIAGDFGWRQEDEDNLSIFFSAPEISSTKNATPVISPEEELVRDFHYFGGFTPAHTCMDYEKLINVGIEGIIRKITESKIEALKDDPKGCFPKMYDADLDAEKPYFVMEYFPNGCLNEKTIASWDLDKKIHFYVFLMMEVAFAHTNNIIHRDLKPENIFLDDKLNPKVSDFGICYIDDDGTRNTLIDEAVGSFKFMAPEMEDGRSELVGPQSDVYSVAKIAYWLFSGGKIYNRERHREEQFNLANNSKWAWKN